MRRAALLGIALLAAACGGGGDPPSEPATSPTCEVGVAAPEGFSPSGTFEEPYEDRIGVRLGFTDAQGREFHAFAGIPGEFGEGLPPAGEIDLAAGGTGVVLGRDDVWVVRWDEGDRCDPRVILVNGFTRKAFDTMLVDAGLVVQADG